MPRNWVAHRSEIRIPKPEIRKKTEDRKGACCGHEELKTQSGLKLPDLLPEAAGLALPREPGFRFQPADGLCVRFLGLRQ